jgi:hypothetical protein
MKLISIIITAALLCGCRKPAQRATSIQYWEYKVVTVKNDIGEIEEYEATNKIPSSAIIDCDSDSGEFHLNEGGSDDYRVDMDELGREGWELVSAVPQIETVPGAEKEVGTVFNVGTDKLDPNMVKFTNIRTGKIILIFKRQT